jgi:hypothetical protein
MKYGTLVLNRFLILPHQVRCAHKTTVVLDPCLHADSVCAHHLWHVCESLLAGLML